MKFIIDETPKMCPQCGFQFRWDQYNRQDFFAGASQQCNCGAAFQYAPAKTIIDSASQHGDMHKYHEVAR